MQTLTRETHAHAPTHATAPAPERTGRSRRWLLPAIAALALVVLAGGVWAIIEADDQADDQTVATELVDTWIRGWNGQDDDAIGSAFTADAVIDGFRVTQHVDTWREEVTNVSRASEVTPTSEKDEFTWTMEFDWNGSRWSRGWTIELDGDLIARAVLAPNYTQVDS